MSRPEAEVQRAIVRALALALPAGAVIHHSGHEQRQGGAAGRRAQAVGVGMGVMAGWPDLIVLCAGRVALLEVKGPAGRVSPAQRAAHARLAAAGFPVAVVRGIEEAAAACSAAGMELLRMEVSR